MGLIHEIFGTGRDLTIINMICRAVVIFFIALFCIRIAGARTFAKKSAFDDIIVIMLGAILSRPIVGASPFVPTICGALMLVLIHRLLGYLGMYNKTLSRMIKGEHMCLFRDGEFVLKNMKQSNLGKEDLMEEIRSSLHESDTAKVQEIFLERGGKISIIKKKE